MISEDYTLIEDKDEVLGKILNREKVWTYKSGRWKAYNLFDFEEETHEDMLKLLYQYHWYSKSEIRLHHKPA